MLQIIFNEISAAEISQLPIEMQLEVLTEFKVSRDDLETVDGERFGRLSRGGKTLYRYRATDLRIYFEFTEEGVVVHRVLNRNTLQDFLYRSNFAAGEDEALSQSKVFWELIEEGEKARKV